MANELYSTLPLLLISGFSIIALMIDALIKNSARHLLTFSAIAFLAVVLSAAMVMPNTGTAFSGMIITGGYASFFDIIFAFAGFLTVLSAHPYLERLNFELNEFYSMVIFAVSGMMLMGHANSLLTVFIGVEVMSISFYVLSGYLRNKISSIESALKYFLLGSFATGFLLYGMALIYGSTGSIEFSAIHKAVQAGSQFPLLLILGIGLMIVGLSFKAAAFPFHSWAPDVYQGAPTVVTGFMSTAGKAAAFSAFIPVMNAVMPVHGSPETVKIQMLLAFIAAGSMIFGNVTAISQTNIKRMLAYSSIAHAGYLLMGIVANSGRGMSGIMYYAAAYLFMQLGAFVIVSILEDKEGNNLDIKDYTGLGKRHPVFAALMAIFMFSLTGIPPFAGFFGKYYLFTAAIEAGFTWLTILGVLTSVVSVYFYLRLVVLMYFQPQESDQQEIVVQPGLANVSLWVSIVGVCTLGFIPYVVIQLTDTFFK